MTRKLLSSNTRIMGIGGGAKNVLNYLIKSGLEGIDFLAVNTDSSIFLTSLCPNKILLGEAITEGRGTKGSNQLGQKAAEESIDEIMNVTNRCQKVILISRLRGGAGSGATPIIAKVCKEIGAITIAIVSMPFILKEKGGWKMHKTL